jgi:hypothetical protein
MNKDLEAYIDAACDELPDGINKTCSTGLKKYVPSVLNNAKNCDYALLQNSLMAIAQLAQYMEDCPADFFPHGRPSEKDKAIEKKFIKVGMELANEVADLLHESCSCKISSWK